MHKNVLILITLILFCKISFSQDWNEIYYLEGEAQYLIEEKDYDKAIDVYRKMIREIPEYSYAKYKIGILYLQTDDQKKLAIPYLEEASQNIALDFDEKSLREIRTPVDVLLYLGEAYQLANRIDEAVVVYNNLKSLIKPEDELYPIVNHRLKTCENAKTAFNNPIRVKKTNLGEPVNTDDPNFGAVFSGDGNTVIYTSYTRNYLDNYYAVKENGVWSSPKKISEKLSGKFYLRTVSLSYDGSILFLATDEEERNDLFVCYKDGRNWIEAEKLPKTINGKKSNETHACITKDEKTLYFTSDMDGGQGGFDIYKSTVDEKGKWGDPVNLGPAVNTPYDEATPFLTLDDKYLFFSSEGHNSIGGLDIFYIDLESMSQAVHLGYPANTTADDNFFVPDNSLTAGYISDYDSTSIGKRDIYYISILQKINLAGNISSRENKQISDASFEITLSETISNNVVETINTNTVNFQAELNPGTYDVSIQSDQFETYTDQITIPESYQQDKYNYTATLNPIAAEEELIAEIIEEPESEITDNQEEQKLEEQKQALENVQKNEIAEAEIELDEQMNSVEEEEIVSEESTEPEDNVEEKYIPETRATGSGQKTYSVQLMALKNPVKVDYFKDVDHVVLSKYPDGFYRYTVGNTTSYQEAKQIKEKINQKGYKDAFIRINDASKSTYTIQIMALIIPVKPAYFNDLSSVVVTKGADDYFRYTVGDYATYEEARSELSNIRRLGYTQAYVKKMNN